MYLSMAENFAAEAKERYGDTEKAAEWLAEELAVLEAKMHDPQEWNAIRF